MKDVSIIDDDFMEGEIVTRVAESPAAREKQLENLAINLAEKQLKDGTASPSVITHFLKLASTRDEIERDVMRSQAILVRAKAEQIQVNQQAQDSAQKAMEAMKQYSGTNADDHL